MATDNQRSNDNLSNRSLPWQSRGLCGEEDPELFFPIGNSGPALLQIEEAKAVCHRCPVMDECLQWALNGALAEFGVWGGQDEDERRAMKRRAARDRARNKAA
jgi:WhiB family redox-sensing transcriptional regulator